MRSPSEAELPRHFPGGQLRRLQPSDLAAFQAYRSVPELGRYQGWSPLSEAQARAFLAEMNEAPLFARGEWVQLGIAESAAGRLIGDIGLFIAADGQSAEVGFTLEPAAQGQGIATAAVREALQLVFEATQVQQVLGITDGRNAASVRLLERVGFRHTQSRNALFRDEPCVEEIFALPRPDA